MMRDGQGREVARFGDAADHGGRIVEGAPGFTQKGVPVVLDGHGVERPKCGGTFPGIATVKLTQKGRPVADIGDAAACGAIILQC